MTIGIPQQGIYYKRETSPGSSLGLVFLRCVKGVQSSGIGRDLGHLWKRLDALNAISNDLEYKKQTKLEEMSILIGYGDAAFSIGGVNRQKPNELLNWHFAGPTGNGGEVANGSKLLYADDVKDDRAIEDLIVLQFISNSETSVSRNIMETFQCLEGTNLNVSRFYTGFNDSQRNWMGFYDGISNLKSEEREHVIFIQKKDYSEEWLVNGTYMIFLRIAIDLRSWLTTKTTQQELMIGREKSTGCPITKVDSQGNPIVEHGCPLPGTKNVTDTRNNIFREYSNISRTSLDSPYLDRLKYSHIGTFKGNRNFPPWDSRSHRIFRQGYEFLEASESRAGFIAGLNFISFQNTPERLFGSLTSWQKGKQFETEPTFFPGINSFLRVHSAGIFLVPPICNEDTFPGSSIFTSSRSY